jgi:TonB family protein
MKGMRCGSLALGLALLAAGAQTTWAQNSPKAPPPLPGQKGSGGSAAPSNKNPAAADKGAAPGDKNAAPEPETVAVSIVSKIPQVDRDNLKSYWAGVESQTKGQWLQALPAAAKPPLSASGEVKIVGWIHTDGRVTNMALEHGSGKAALDRAAWAAITGSVPYGAFPYGIAADQVKVRFTFDYNGAGPDGGGLVTLPK